MNDERLEAIENADSVSSQRPAVITNFSGYIPPFDVVPIVEKMVASVPPKYLIGLSKVVLTNSSGLSRKLRRSVTKARKHKVRVVEARGLYRQAWHGEQAWVQIFVDNTLARWEKGWWLKFSYMREMLLGDVLFHEIGHHIHYTTRPEYREKEDVADVWKVRLVLNYNRRRFPLIKDFFKLIAILFGPLYKWQFERLMKEQLQKGWISRAEYDERVTIKKSKD